MPVVYTTFDGYIEEYTSSSTAPGFLIWKNEDGTYTQVLEFVNYVPETGDDVSIEYFYKSEDGSIKYHVDYPGTSAPGREDYRGRKADTPDTSRQIEIFTIDDLPSDHTTALPGQITQRDLASLANAKYGTQWRNIKFGVYHWNDSDLTSSGRIEHLVDAIAPSGYDSYLGGVEDEDALRMDRISITPSGEWVPDITAGGFFIGNRPYYLLRQKRQATLGTDVTSVGISGANPAYPVSVYQSENGDAGPNIIPLYRYRMYEDALSEENTHDGVYRQLPNWHLLSGIYDALEDRDSPLDSSLRWSPSGQQFWLSHLDFLQDISTSGVYSEQTAILVNILNEPAVTLNVEYDNIEVSGYYSILNGELDVNPNLSPFYHNKILIVTSDETPVSGNLALFTPDTVAVNTNELVHLRGRLTDKTGIPLYGRNVTVDTANATGTFVTSVLDDGTGISDSVVQSTSPDGTVHYRFRISAEALNTTQPMSFRMECRTLDIYSNWIDVDFAKLYGR